MTDILQLPAEEKRKFATLSQLSQQDIDSIWTDVSSYIRRQLALWKGVHLAGLGTFTFSQQKLDIGNKFTPIQKPIFLPADKLTRFLGLKQTRPLASATQQPAVQLNFAAVSQESRFSRATLERCVRETLWSLSRALATQQHVFLTFQGIGVLIFKNNTVRMKFNKDFVNALNGSGLLAVSKRPGSSVSSAPQGLQRSQNAQQVTLQTVCCLPPNKDVQFASPGSDQTTAADVPPQQGLGCPQILRPAEKKVGHSGEMNPPPSTDKQEDTTLPGTTTSNRPPATAHKHANCSDHTRAGQELCYLCMQWAQRNVPVYVKEQQQAEEKAQEKLLLLKAQQNDTQRMLEEQAKLDEHRQHTKQVAEFNLQMSKNKEKPSCSLHPTSFLFPARPLTPARRARQRQYLGELQTQMESRQRREARDQFNHLVLEHLDQAQLVQEVAAQKSQGLQQKQQRTRNYKMALDAQVQDKKDAEAAECQPDGCRWDRCETPFANTDRRERAKQTNFSSATQRRKEELRIRQERMENEREILKQNRKELTLDRIKRHEKRQEMCKSLESDWSHGIKLKHQREDEERRFLRSAGQLLVEKVAQYKCCRQCKRRTSNCGESNIWKDSHYISGSQFMT